MITVTTPANSTALTTLAAVKQMLKIEGTDEDLLLGSEIAAASASVSAYCHRTFAREGLSETVKGYGGPILMLGRAPVARLGTILGNASDPITDAILENADAGLIYRKRNWDNTIQLGWAITETPRPGSEDPLYVVAYSAGYLLPGDDIEADGGISVDATLKQFVLDPEFGSFPLTLVSGDRVYVQGFVDPRNNGWFTVFAVTAQTLTVQEATLQNEVVGEGIRTMALATLPADVELATRETVRDLRLSRRRDASVGSKTVGDLSITYRDPRALASGTGQYAGGLPMDAAMRLVPYVRAA